MSKASIIFILLLAGSVMIRYFILSESIKTFAEGDKISVQTRLLRSPKIDNRVQKLTLIPKGYEALYVVTGSYPRYSYGEKIRVTGEINVRILENGERFATLYFPTISNVDDGNLLFTFTRFIRERVHEAFASRLPPTSASLLLGIVFGVKEGLPEDFESALQTTGVFHVIAASGMNVSMLAGFLMASLGKVLRRQVALLLSMIAIGFYTVLAGLEPSIVRAALMALIAFSALLLGRQGTALWSLTLTALFMLLFDPFLYQDIGFQLSFAATLGILLIKPLLTLNFRGTTPLSGDRPLSDTQKNPTLALLSEDLGSTISAQIATVPILLFYFHQYGLLSVPVNALVLWTIPPLMVIGSVSAMVALVLPSLAGWLSLLGLPFLWLFEHIIKLLEPYNPVFKVENLSKGIVFGYYLVLGSVICLKKWGSRGLLRL